jgi:branched-chain amino acid transport system permease protein
VSATSPTDVSGADVVPRSRADIGRLLGWQRASLLPLAVVVVVVGLIPLATSNSYLLNLIILIFIYSVLNQAWNLTLGMTGAWNFGQLALFAIGGYAAGISQVQFGVSPWVGLLIGALLAAVANVILAIPSMRLRGIYVCLLTFSFAEVTRLAIINDGSGLTGGVFGLTNIVGPFDSMSAQAGQRAFYWLALAACILTAVIIQRVMNSPYGIAFQGIRDSSRYASSLGISYRVYYVAATTLSALLSGVAGALYAFHYSTISPSVMGLTPMSLLVLMIVVGGLGTVSGPIVGTAVVMVLTEFLRGAGAWRMLFLGVVLLAVLMLRPTGLARLFDSLGQHLRTWMNADQAGSGNGDEEKMLAGAASAKTDAETGRRAAGES